MLKIISVIFLLQIFLFAKVELDLNKISNYKTTKEYYSKKDDKFLLFRSFSFDKKSYFLLLNLNSLKTFIINKEAFLGFKKENANILNNSNYSFLVTQTLHNSKPLSNAGIKEKESLKAFDKKIFITVDMCPSSKKGFEKEFFENLIKRYHTSIPISIAITYKWVKTHQDEFLWLINKKELNITWINHSKMHYYNSKEKDLSKNFMLYNLKDLDSEILDVEKLLILNHQIPSFLFRFPGLVSNQFLVKELLDKYSLIPLGTNNWLAKEDKIINSGDIVLVHGNKNEHKGIKIINNDIILYKPESIIKALIRNSK